MVPGARCSFLVAIALGALGTGVSTAVTIRVPQDRPRIGLALEDAAAGDTVLVACGTYAEHSLPMASGVVLRSETGDPACVTIDASRVSTAFICQGVDAEAAIEGFTVTGGDPVAHGGGLYGANSDLRISDCVFVDNLAGGSGGAVAFQAWSSPLLERCRFEGNRADNAGGLYFETGSPRVEDCVIVDNVAHLTGGGVVWLGASAATFSGCVVAGNEAEVINGGGVSVNASTVTIENCTIYGNTCPGNGAGVHVRQAGHVDIVRTIVAFNSNAHSVFCSQASTADLACSVLFKNDEGDWIDDCVADQRHRNGNFDRDPLFCDRSSGDLTLRADSPCAPDINPCGLVGALGVGCGAPVALVRTSFGRVKMRYKAAGP